MPPQPNSPVSPPLEPPSTELTAANTNTVRIPPRTSVLGCENNECFIPAAITVNVNEEVVWRNDDTATHTVTSGAPESDAEHFDSGLFLVGAEFTWTSTEEGEYPYFCIIHPWMLGTVTVLADPATEPTSQPKPETPSSDSPTPDQPGTPLDNITPRSNSGNNNSTQSPTFGVHWGNSTERIKNGFSLNGNLTNISNNYNTTSDNSFVAPNQPNVVKIRGFTPDGFNYTP